MENLYKTDITGIKDEISETIANLGLPEKKKKLLELEKESLKEGFWKDNIRAKNTLSKIDYIKREIEEANKLQKDSADLEEMFDIITEEREKKQLIDEFKNLKERFEKFKKLKYLSGKFDKSGCILSIHAGQGGTEAQDWVEMLLRMYTKHAERQNWQVKILHKVTGTEAGLSSVTIQINGIYAYGYLKKETGTHRLVRISPFNAQGLRQTSFAGVEVIPIIEENEGEIEIPEKDIEFKAVKSGGPGGQHVNKTSSAVVIKHIPTGITVQCSEGREQFKNRQTAMKMLKSKLTIIEEERQEREKKELKGEHKIAGWGNQIRNYVLQPYKLVKDLRTNIESTDPGKVLDGDLDIFLEAQLKI